MSWLQPWAFAGLLAIAVPILIHLLTRGRTRVRRFPSLRFISTSRLPPVRALRPTDALLMVVRCAIIAAAGAALAQPLLRTAGRARETAGTLARVIVVDTSASMRRAALDGGAAIEVARRAAARAAADADAGVVVETDAPARELRGAAEWLRHQTGRREILVVSDFQMGALVEPDVAAVPAGVGIAFSRVAVRADTGALTRVARYGDVTTVARATLAGASTDADWAVRSVATDTLPPVQLLAGREERTAARAVLSAVRPFIAATRDTARALAIVFPGYEGRAALERTAAPLNAAWMGDVAARVWAGERVTGAGRAVVDGRERLLLFADSAPGTFASAALVLAAGSAVADQVPVTELEPETIGDARLAAWRREPSPASIAAAGGDASDARWLWLAALLLLGLETLLRRPRERARADPAGGES